jgi:sigma-B regulation protein RsbU (phosphoserine phosphatase)
MRIKLGRGIVGTGRGQPQVDPGRRRPQGRELHRRQPQCACPNWPCRSSSRTAWSASSTSSPSPAYFTEEHQRLLELTASRMAVAVENARLYTRVSRQAQTLTVLNEISREITSILDLDDLLERIGQLLKRVIDFQMFTILLWNDRTERLSTGSARASASASSASTTSSSGRASSAHAAQGAPRCSRPTCAKTRVTSSPTPRCAPNSPSRSSTRARSSASSTSNTPASTTTTRTTRPRSPPSRRRSPSPSPTRGSISASTKKSSAWSATWPWRAKSSCACCPARPPQPRHAEIAAAFLPARSIGGDMYDFIDYGAAGNELYTTTQPKRIAIVLGDVSGKAAPAALYAALVSGILRSLSRSPPCARRPAHRAQRPAPGAQARRASTSPC